ncbi:hypothetical protein GH714_042538 [Hevea brasiliensis]|uniref:Large ribosomal subunit protein bL12 C-terminal domain-containing protein n=1 Tax=Hevea brasiliensis TaxID=3981 RepID=A0A6A6JZQ4_HEVBR|nr:hypothetical protein GH714_042538 [Hevea brasiliensis]
MSNVDLDSLAEQICGLDLCSAAALVEKIEDKLGFPKDKKIAVIKAVRECTTLGLKEAKDFVEQEGSRELIEGKKYKKAEAEEVKKKLEDAGATVSVK